MIHNFSSDIGDNQAPNQRSADFRSDVEQDEPLLGIYNPDSQDLATATRMAREILRNTGAKLNVFARTDNADNDKTWDEDPDPTYNPAVLLRGYFKPQPMEFELKRWGVDATNKTEVVFCASDVRERWGERMLRPGDVLELPYNSPAGDSGGGGSLSPGFYRVVNATPSGNYRYHWLYFTCTVETLTADITVRVVEDMPMRDTQFESGGYVDGSS